jgi:hypothetical protein
MKTKTTMGTVATVIGLTTATLATLASTPAYADFYDGAPLPPEKSWQEQVNVDVGEDVGLTAITKYVPANGHTVSVLAVGETDGALHHGFAQGYRFDVPFDNGNYLGVLPMVQGSIGAESVTLAPTLYTTVIAGRWTLDPRIQTPIAVTYSGNVSLDAVVTGTTVGVAVNDNLRIGSDMQVNVLAPEDSLTLGTMLRYDPPRANRDHWMQFGLTSTLEGTASAQVQYRMNF